MYKIYTKKWDRPGGFIHKLLLIMRLTTVILLATLMQLSAASFGQKFTYSKRGSTLAEVFQAIETQTGYSIFFANQQIDKRKKIDVSFKDTELKEALDVLAEKSAFEYAIDEKNISIKPKTPSFLSVIQSAAKDLFADDDRNLADIRGVVRNERGEPLEGITVMVKGAKAGTRTNEKGEFLLKGVKKGDVLVFTGVAIEPFEYTVKDDKNIDLNLKARLVQLEEVGINTGYQKISRERFVGSYSQLDSAAFHRRAGMGILERLDGTVTGVLFNKKVFGNNPDQVANFSPIQIRGISTLESNQNPLIIVDNFPYTFDLSTLNPNDIQDITVLKDAAATSIWGSRAGNGVIVITTKKGKFNQPLHVSWNSNLTIQDKPDLYYNSQVSSSDFIDFERELFSEGAYDFILADPSMGPVSPVVDVLNQVRNGSLTESEGNIKINNLRNVDTRDQLNRYVYQNGVSQQHSVNIGGGNNNINYSISLGYNNTKPDIKNSENNDQYTINSTASFKVGKRVNISTGINLSQGTQRTAALPAFSMYPYLQLADENGNALPVVNRYRISYVDTVGKGKLLDWHFRPLDELKFADQSNITRNNILNAGISYAAVSWLTLEFLGQYNFQNTDASVFKSIESFETRNLINRFTNLTFTDLQRRYPIPLGGILDKNSSKSNSYNFRGGISVNKNWNNHQFSAMISGDLSDARGSSNSSRYYGYQPDFAGYSLYMDYVNRYLVYPLNTGSTDQIPTENKLVAENISRFVSLTGNVSYMFRNKYSIYGSARRDGSNLFGVSTNNKWKPLWSVGVAWQIDKEKFFDLSWIDQLKLRSSFGYSGNVNNTIPGILTITILPNPNFLTGLKSAIRGNLPNPNLRWEEVKIFNSGVDFSLFKNRISGNVEYYRKSSVDLITAIGLAPSVGATFNNMNVASLKGGGLDLNLNAKVLQNDIHWSIQVGLSHAKMKVEKMYLFNNYGAIQFVSSGINPSIGKIAFGLGSYKWAGLDPETGDPRGVLNGEISKDYWGIMSDSVDNQVFHGSSIPLYSGFVTNNFSWRKLSISFNIGYKFGFYFRKPTIDYLDLASKSFLHSDYYKRWQKPGDEKYTSVPSLTYPSNDPGRDEFYSKSEVNVLRGDHIRLQDIRVQYNFDALLKHNSVFKNLSAFMYANNLNVIVWRKNKSNLDPDYAGSNNNLLTPPVKSLTFGLSANF
ncbi:SusC/RagA family TonB-linked outer membrane protein [Pedobacter africanus]|uniref:TonB-linked outer membrane protein, SusC/RagA family n=1 Tax=Pedobacter africanus TaxID=151894 RepID=A0A1W2CUS6_9SPHI|nr:SusC/RagA family TonB-linked outer membrane protein [Pedobacter africanus]SMC88654.1 TonB-linked outer membrane protein, SusC/RagA family [Pedobacter africanus]